MAEITIRQAGADDVERLNEALWHLAVHLDDPHGATPDLLREAGFGANPSFRALLAETGGTVVGAALYSPVFSTIRSGAGVYVSDLWVAPETRGSGLGRRLLKAVAEDAATVWSVKFLRLVVYNDNAEARAFYDRLGFVASEGEIILTLDEPRLVSLTTG
jgi:ribosomal protein S18 acetylase RimI-like enzyme